jgi:hypothetical protein
MPNEYICCTCKQPKNHDEMEGGSRKGRRCKGCDSKRQRERRNANRAKWKEADPYAEHPTGIKRCTKCKVDKPVRKFGKETHTKDGLNHVCGLCLNNYLQLKKYGVVAEAHDRCEICGNSTVDRRKKRLCIDHCHETGKIRGKLCNFCNSGLGHFKDSVSLLTKATEYLRKYE